MKYRSLESSQVRVLRNAANVWNHMSRVTSRCLEQFKWSACDSTVLLSTFFFFFSTGFGRVFSGSRGIWLKYRAGCGKMWDLLTGYGIWLLHRGSDRDSLKSWEKRVFGKEMTEVWDLGLTWQRNGKAGLGRLRDFHGQFFLAGARNKSYF